MSVYVKVLDKPQLKPTEMICDRVIHKKLEKYPMIKQCFSTSSFNVILGKQGDGKTSLVFSLMSQIFEKCFHYIYIVMPEACRKSLKEDILEDLPEDQIYSDLNVEVLEELKQKINKNAMDNKWSLLIIVRPRLNGSDLLALECDIPPYRQPIGSLERERERELL